MSAIIGIFAVPFGYVMRFIYEFVGNYGLSIVLFSLLAKLIMTPLTIKQKRSMMKTQALQPKIQQLQKQYGKDQQRLQQELQALYDREDASPTAGCGTTIITLPIMMGLYYVISQPLTYFMRLTSDQISRVAEILNYNLTGAAGQIPLAGQILDHFERVRSVSPNVLPVDYNFLGMNLAQTPSLSDFNILWLIPLFSGLTALGMSLVQMAMQRRNNPESMTGAAAQSSKMMMLMMPMMSVVFGFMLPAGLGIYWIANNVFSAASEVALNPLMQRERQSPKKPPKPPKPPTRSALER
jgi:YidC/Oxa1 family membrane protein insertase